MRESDRGTQRRGGQRKTEASLCPVVQGRFSSSGEDMFLAPEHHSKGLHKNWLHLRGGAKQEVESYKADRPLHEDLLALADGVHLADPPANIPPTVNLMLRLVVCLLSSPLSLSLTLSLFWRLSLSAYLSVSLSRSPFSPLPFSLSLSLHITWQSCEQ